MGVSKSSRSVGQEKVNDGVRLWALRTSYSPRCSHPESCEACLMRSFWHQEPEYLATDHELLEQSPTLINVSPISTSEHSFHDSGYYSADDACSSGSSDNPSSHKDNFYRGPQRYLSTKFVKAAEIDISSPFHKLHELRERYENDSGYRALIDTAYSLNSDSGYRSDSDRSGTCIKHDRGFSPLDLPARSRLEQLKDGSMDTPTPCLRPNSDSLSEGVSDADVPFPVLSSYVQAHDYRSISSASPVASPYHPRSPTSSQTSNNRSRIQTSTTAFSRIPPDAPPRPVYAWDKHATHSVQRQPAHQARNNKVLHAYWSHCKSGACDHLFHASVTLPAPPSDNSTKTQLPHRGSDPTSPRAYHQRQVSAYCEEIDRRLSDLANAKLESGSLREGLERPEWVDAEPKVAAPKLKVLKRATRSSDASASASATPVKMKLPRVPLQSSGSRGNVGVGLDCGRHMKEQSEENVAPMLGRTA
ncbi:hypothetical protein LTS18_003682 [Coniosporium uncinatum]|uniref:Uncharacterized protein n=1 Tax=Coniosporium uncinatum TaxID=93489 RepID=A0ACC3D6T0_9PEZI|nr:hypothetical protein LTS18_003682 [Coniosporium uncinatum]